MCLGEAGQQWTSLLFVCPPVCPSVCPSVRLSVSSLVHAGVHWSAFGQAKVCKRNRVPAISVCGGVGVRGEGWG